MLEYLLSPLASWFGVSIPIFLLVVIALFTIIGVLRG